MYLVSNYTIYIVQIVFDIYGVFKVTLDNHSKLRRFSIVVNVVAIILSIWAFFAVEAEVAYLYDQNHTTKNKDYNEKWEALQRLISWMIWMRLVIVVMILLAFLVTFIALTLMLLVNRRRELFEEQRRETGRRATEDRVRTFIKNKQRKYDTVKHLQDKNVEMCCICLD